jgi:hypothetical protein
VIWSRAEHEERGVRLVLSDSDRGDVDLHLTPVRAGELGRALFGGGSAYGVEAASVDGDAANVWVANNEIHVTVAGEAPFVFVLEAEEARQLGASILERPVSYEVECPSCGTRTWARTRVAPSSEIAEARASTEHWTCPVCATRVRDADLVGYSDDVWRVPK